MYANFVYVGYVRDALRNYSTNFDEIKINVCDLVSIIR